MGNIFAEIEAQIQTFVYESFERVYEKRLKFMGIFIKDFLFQLSYTTHHSWFIICNSANSFCQNIPFFHYFNDIIFQITCTRCIYMLFARTSSINSKFLLI